MLPRFLLAMLLTLPQAWARAEPALAGVGDADGDGLPDHAVLLDERVRVAGADGTVFTQVDLGADAFAEHALAALPDLDGNGSQDVAVLGVHGDGSARCRILDARTGAAQPDVAFPAGPSYRRLDVVADHDGAGTPLLVAWGISRQGAVVAQLRQPDGGALRTIDFRRGQLVDAAIIQAGAASRLVALLRVEGGNLVVVRGVSGAELALFHFESRWLPVGVAALAEPAGDGTIAFLGQARDTNQVMLAMRRVGGGPVTGRAWFGAARQPRALAALRMPDGEGGFAALTQNAASAQVRAVRPDGTTLATLSLPKSRQWSALAATAAGDEMRLAALAPAADGSAESRGLTLAGGAVVPVAHPAPPVQRFPQIARLAPARDATIYESEDSGSGVANGAGAHWFAGRTGEGRLTRTLLHFDVAAALPAGSRVVDVRLEVFMSMTRNPAMDIDIHRLFADWTEGPSAPGGGEGGGAAALPGDATWFYRSFPALRWRDVGGDLNPVPRGAARIAAAAAHSFAGTPELVEDVQRWLDWPADNHGWLLQGANRPGNDLRAMRFDSRTNPVPEQRPVLRVLYAPPPGD